MNTVTLKRVGLYSLWASVVIGTGYLAVKYIQKRMKENEEMEEFEESEAEGEWIKGEEGEFEVKEGEEAEDFEADSSNSKSEEGPIVTSARQHGQLPPLKEVKVRSMKVTDYSGVSKTHQVKPSLNEVVKNSLANNGANDYLEEDSLKEKLAIVGARQLGPYVITFEEFIVTHNRKVTLTYFETDDTLADLHGEPVTSPAEFLGVGALQKFGSGSGDPDVVYIRNNERGTDYEITMQHASFNEMVLGIVPVKRRDRKVLNTLGKEFRDGETTNKRRVRKVEKEDDDSMDE